MDFNNLYDFEIEFEKGGEKLVFDMYQNIELNQKYSEFENDKKKIPEFRYQLDNGSFILINFSQERVINIGLQKGGKLLKKISRTLKKGV